MPAWESFALSQPAGCWSPTVHMTSTMRYTTLVSIPSARPILRIPVPAGPQFQYPPARVSGGIPHRIITISPWPPSLRTTGAG